MSIKTHALDDLLKHNEALFGNPRGKPTATELMLGPAVLGKRATEAILGRDRMGHLGNEIYNDVVSEMMPPWKELEEADLATVERHIDIHSVSGRLTVKLCNQLRFYRRLTERLLPYANTLRIEELEDTVSLLEDELVTANMERDDARGQLEEAKPTIPGSTDPTL